MIDHVASFVGFVPASRPALVVLVSLDTPRGRRNQGGDVAAPLFARIAEPALRRLAIPPDDPDRVLRAVVATARRRRAAAGLSPPPAAPRPRDRRPARAEPGLMPDLRGPSAREARHRARRGAASSCELKGSGRVVTQTPEPGAEVEAGLTCVLPTAVASEVAP